MIRKRRVLFLGSAGVAVSVVAGALGLWPGVAQAASTLGAQAAT